MPWKLSVPGLVRISTRPNPGRSNSEENGFELMRISRIELFGGNWPPLKPSMKNCAPFGPAAGPASASRSACRSSGSSGSCSRSASFKTSAPTLLDASVESCAADVIGHLYLLRFGGNLQRDIEADRLAGGTSRSARDEWHKAVGIRADVVFSGRNVGDRVAPLAIVFTERVTPLPVATTVAFGNHGRRRICHHATNRSGILRPRRRRNAHAIETRRATCASLSILHPTPSR